VSVAAVGLLVLAGRQFFLNGIKTSPGISSTRAYAEAPALIAERERKQERESEVSITVPIASERNENASLDMLVKREERPSEVKVAANVVPETSSQKNVNVSQPKAQPKTQPAKNQPAKPQPAKTQPVKPQPAKNQPAKTQPAKTQPAKKSINTACKDIINAFIKTMEGTNRSLYVQDRSRGSGKKVKEGRI
jgi:cell division protein FtsN